MVIGLLVNLVNCQYISIFETTLRLHVSVEQIIPCCERRFCLLVSLQRHCHTSRTVVISCLSIAYVANLSCVFCWSHSLPHIALPSILLAAILYLVCVFVWSMSCHNYLRAALISDPIVFDAYVQLTFCI